MHSKRNEQADYQTDETKEKLRKFDLKPFDFYEERKNFVNFCEKKLYECIYNGRFFKKLMSSSKQFNFFYLKYFKYFNHYIQLVIRYLN